MFKVVIEGGEELRTVLEGEAWLAVSFAQGYNEEAEKLGIPERAKVVYVQAVKQAA